MSTLKRVAFFIDGFNLFGGLRETKLRQLRWLDIEKLAFVIASGQGGIPTAVHYFTSKIKPMPQYPYAVANQEMYWAALESRKLVQFHYGDMQEKDVYCHLCKSKFTRPIEKKTDVKIGIHAVSGAFKDEFDMAYIVSGDTDLMPVMEFLDNFNLKGRSIEMRIAFPPHRSNVTVMNSFRGKWEKIKINTLKQCLLLTQFSFNGLKILRPPRWDENFKP